MRRSSVLATNALLAAAALVSVCGSTLAQAAPQRPAITGIAFARFYETNPTAAQHFYGDILGYERLTVGDATTYPVNSSQWIETVPHIGPKPNDRLAAVAFTTRDAAGLERYLASKGFPSEQSLRNDSFSVRDPEGNLVIFVQQDSNKAVLHAKASPHATSHRIIHVGFLVNDAAKEDRFWRDALGFKPYWHGGQKSDTATDYISQQVPDGTDWLEYMLNSKPNPSLQTVGVLNHFSLGTENMDTVVAALKTNNCTDANCSKTQLGRDGKIQLNLFDPDLSRVEYMEFKARKEPCCSPFTGPSPTETENR